MNTQGLHHVTAVTGKAKENVKFYTDLLGLRLVKKTVNQDDVSAYHLFYADAVGSPGTDMTFFDWKQAGAKRERADEISRTYFRVNGTAALEYWEERFDDKGVNHSGLISINSKDALLFEDFEGQKLGLIHDEGAPFDGKVWDKHIPSEHALRGFYAVELSVHDPEPIESVLSDVLEWQNSGSYTDSQNYTVIVFAMDGGGPGKEVHVRELPDAPYITTSSAGSVHHVAFRVQDENEMKEWIDHLEKMNVPYSGIIDRFYFQSLYFRISPGILFELATDGPGFSADEDPKHLGEKLALPPFLEPHRQQIEDRLEPL